MHPLYLNRQKTVGDMLDRVKNKTKSYASVEDWIYSETKGIVQSGPFAGMAILNETAWKDGNLSTKCLGCYEEELHAAFEHQIERLSAKPSPKIVDIGCAEGYYAVGLVRRVPSATMYGVDISKESIAILQRAAARNGVIIRTDASIAEVFDAPDLVVMDVEGHESEYLDLRKFPSLRQADIIVECHDVDSRDRRSHTRMLTAMFSETHEIENIYEGPRNPNMFPMLARQQSIFRWMAVCEGRPRMMNWLVMKAKER